MPEVVNVWNSGTYTLNDKSMYDCGKPEVDIPATTAQCYKHRTTYNTQTSISFTQVFIYYKLSDIN